MTRKYYEKSQIACLKTNEKTTHQPPVTNKVYHKKLYHTGIKLTDNKLK